MQQHLELTYTPVKVVIITLYVTVTDLWVSLTLESALICTCAISGLPRNSHQTAEHPKRHCGSLFNAVRG